MSDADYTHLKFCKSCAAEKPISEFYKHSRSKDGLDYVCKECKRKQSIEYYFSHHDAAKASRARYRVENKDATRERDKAYRAVNSQKIAEIQRQYRAANVDRLKEKDAKKYLAKSDYYKAKAAQWREENRERRNIREANWRRDNPEKVASYARTVRATRRGATGKHTAADIRALLELQRGTCAVCRKKLPKTYHVDHIQPLAKGGTNDRLNLQILCAPCNLAKNARDPVEFMQSRGFLL